MKENQEYCSVKEFAELTGINLMTAYEWVHMRYFPASKINGRIIINVEKAHEWIKRRAITA